MENVEQAGLSACRVIRDLSILAASLERSENVKQVGLWEQLRLPGWLWLGLRALLSALVPLERSEYVERTGMRVRCESRDLSAMTPPECSENVEREGLPAGRQVGLWALLSAMLPPECSENVERVGLR